MSIHHLESPTDRLVIAAEFEQSPPGSVFAYWTDPGLLSQWWPQEAQVDLQVGGSYHLSWPQMNWHLCGRYTAIEPGKLLAFTWKWDHDEEYGTEKEVSIVFEQLSARRTKVVLTQRPYADSLEDQALRIEHHLAGWQHFIPRLQRLLEAS